jgi:hypothetical protein
VESDAFARVCANALAFIPARSQVKTARVEVWPDGFRVTGTDGFAIGQDTAEMDEYEGPPDGAVFHVTREALADLDSAGRKDKKGFGKLVFKPGDGLIFRPANNDVACAVQDVTDQAHAPLWGAVDGLMEKLEGRKPNLPEVLCFDPALLMRFSKVKAAKKTTKAGNNLERGMDLYIFDNAEPILVRIGPTFRGAVMPIQREVHRENVEQDDGGLW